MDEKTDYIRFLEGVFMWKMLKNSSIYSHLKKDKKEDEKKHPMSEIIFMQQEIILPIKNKLLIQKFNVNKDSLYSKEIYFN